MSEAPASLSESELTELDEFLLSDACDEETLSIEESHGFLSALIAGPEEPSQDQWMPMVWGEPAFAGATEAERMKALLMRLHDEIAEGLQKGTYEPLIIEEEDEEGELSESYEGWCVGFMIGVEEQQEAWSRLPQDQEALLAPMAQLALLATDEEAEMDEEEYDSWISLLPGAVSGLYHFWHPSH